MLNSYCYISIHETIQLCTKKSLGSFKDVIYKMFTNQVFNIYVKTGFGIK